MTIPDIDRVRTRLKHGLRTTSAETVAARRRLVLVVGLIAAAVVVVYLALVLSIGSGIPRGTEVLGVNIGGMTTEQAQEALAASLTDAAAAPIDVTAADHTFHVKPARAGLSLDIPATVALASGRAWNPWTLLRHLVGTVEVPPVVSVDEQQLTAEVQRIATEVDVPAVEPRLRYKALDPRLKAGTDGQAVNVDAAMELLIGGYLVHQQPVALPVEVVTPTVSQDSAAQTQQGYATAAVSAPVTVVADSVQATLAPQTLAEATSYQARDGALVPVVDGAALHAAIASDLAAVETPGKDATFVIKNDRPVVRPSKEGKGVSDEELASAVSEAMGKPAGERTATVAIGLRPPALTTEQANGLGITEQLSSFTQYFPYAAYRVQNIGQAAKYIDGTVLLPGETFSMNDTIKERTEANGYTEGFVVGPGGIFEEALGGGVSTATTAVWTAAFYAGLERVDTRAHSIWISRYTPGLEATVAWGSFDMKFRNDTPHGVLIKASITDGSITVSMWGTRVYDEVKAESGEKYGIVDFDTVYDESDGCLSQSGVPGFSIDVDRVFFQDGKEVKRETITTRYQPAPTVICGPDPATQPTPTPTPSASGSASAEPSASASARPSASTTPAPEPSASTKPSTKPSEQSAAESDAGASRGPAVSPSPSAAG